MHSAAGVDLPGTFISDSRHCGERSFVPFQFGLDCVLKVSQMVRDQ